MGDKINLLVVGAGFAGSLIVHEVLKDKDFQVICFADDDSKKQGTNIEGIPVVGPTKDIPKIVKESKIDEIIIAIPSLEGDALREIVDLCEESQKKYRILPSSYEVLDALKTGEPEVKELRKVKITDLLRRKPHIMDFENIVKGVKNKNILITGAGGSIGSELARQVAELSPKTLTLLDNSENNLFYIAQELKAKGFQFKINAVLMDIGEKGIEEIMKSSSVDIIFHAAAFKHVPMMEEFPAKAVLNNIVGTKNIINAAANASIEKFVFISTDKAVNPTSVMGATKRICELLIKSVSHTKTVFLSVRFGNVLGSEGSVVKIFEKQIAEGGPVTITHQDMIRYFMTIEEAAQLVIQASVYGNKNEIFVLDMGEPVKVVDLAKDMIRLSGLRVEQDIKIDIIGMRKGEKLYEELLTKDELVDKTKHKRIFIAKDDADKFNTQELEKLIDLAQNNDVKKIVPQIKKIVPTFNHK